MKFYIDFQVMVTTARVIKAETEAEAIRIAEDLMGSDDYRSGVIESMEDDPMNFNDFEFVSLGEADDSYEADNE